MANLFDNNLVYPCDDVGEYVVLDGVISFIETTDRGYYIKVGTMHGIFGGWQASLRAKPKIGYSARIQIYRSGGGYYPDNRIVGWSA